MKHVRQVTVLESKKCDEMFYSYETCINTNLAALAKDSRKSDIKIEYCSSDITIISYLQEASEDELESL